MIEVPLCFSVVASYWQVKIPPVFCTWLYHKFCLVWWYKPSSFLCFSLSFSLRSNYLNPSFLSAYLYNMHFQTSGKRTYCLHHRNHLTQSKKALPASPFHHGRTFHNDLLQTQLSLLPCWSANICSLSPAVLCFILGHTVFSLLSNLTLQSHSPSLIFSEVPALFTPFSWLLYPKKALQSWKQTNKTQNKIYNKLQLHNTLQFPPAVLPCLPTKFLTPQPPNLTTFLTPQQWWVLAIWFSITVFYPG